eukprot:CAMPEP_0185598444 /NCGR_PEP_ID=MMETSP0434-20130131/81997_1 /TAXON_ID=626734 ORGANISM="Favella taraikaensis, Strain Fe Narragansett Bay" /NCGR_SAMPLE_ID=MMETSP0434 /ASSEMBLY_ACC=CAM_ASM_000379 /LENGTH=166 /DNA_ID=CAMNT_0028227427 /DNA_START=1548 /DNA_END=2048 /DNA_ORIENTATION=-
MTHDWDRMLVSRIVTDPEQQRRIKNELICNCQMLSEIYIYLRSKSKTFPYLDPKDVARFFIEKLDFKCFDMLHKATLHNICLETAVQAEQTKGGDTSAASKRLFRHQFFEVLIRMSIWLFSNAQIAAEISGNYSDLTHSQAWYLFLKNKVKPMYEKEQIPLRDFRE